MCDLLTIMDVKIVEVALDGLENILRVGELESQRCVALGVVLRWRPCSVLASLCCGCVVFLYLRLMSSVNSDVNECARFIEDCGGLDKIEFLQSHQNAKIYHKAYTIIDQYFGDEEPE